MEFLSNKPLLITDTILRDAHQSQAATRMTLEQMLPACEILDSIGYYSLECWGGATFDACLRFLDEDPWERLRQLRAHLPHTKLQMLFRGQNILGYKHYADDVVDEFCGKSIDNGIDIIRIFDALNDVRNLEQAIKSTKKYGGQVEATLSYTISPIHNEDYFVKLAKELEQMGADALCIKDMANLLLPMDAYSLVKRLKETVSIPIHLHTHNTSGTGDMVNLMAAMAGVDIVDTALSPLANGTSQPATESLVATLKGTPRDTGLDLNKMSEAAVHFRKVADELKASGALDPKVLNVDTNTLLYQVPGGMLSNLISQLKQAGKEDKYYDVLAEIPRVREDFGYPPLVTPSSQIVGTQAVLNIITGERIREELRKGKTLDTALYSGYHRAFSAILDGNLTGILVSIVLMGAFGVPDSIWAKIFNHTIFWFFGATTEGVIYSFGFTLMTGLIMNFIMGVFAARLMTMSLSRFKCFQNKKLYGGGINVKAD